MHEHTIN